MNTRDHAAGAAALDSLDCRDRRVDDPGVSAKRLQLLGPEGIVCLGRHDQYFLTVPIFHLDDVTRKVRHLVSVDEDQFPSGRAEPVQDSLAFSQIVDRVGADHGKPLTDAHQNVGVVDIHARGIGGAERQEFVPEGGSQFLQEVGVSPGRDVRVDDAVRKIEDDASCPFEKPPLVLVMTHIDDPGHLETVADPERLYDIHTPFQASHRSKHRVDDHGAVVME